MFFAFLRCPEPSNSLARTLVKILQASDLRIQNHNKTQWYYGNTHVCPCASSSFSQYVYLQIQLQLQSATDSQNSAIALM